MKASLWSLAVLGVVVFGAIKSHAQEASAPPDPLSLWETDRSHVFGPDELDLRELVWAARPLIVFADSPNDPQFHQQMQMLRDRPDDLAERDVVIIVDADPSADSELRRQMRPRGFMLMLIDKDGRVALRKPSPWDVRELSRSIDKTPLRQQEIRERRDSASE